MWKLILLNLHSSLIHTCMFLFLKEFNWNHRFNDLLISQVKITCHALFSVVHWTRSGLWQMVIIIFFWNLRVGKFAYMVVLSRFIRASSCYLVYSIHSVEPRLVTMMKQNFPLSNCLTVSDNARPILDRH